MRGECVMEDKFSFGNYNNDQLRELRFFAPMQPHDVILPGLCALKSGNRWEGIPVECKICERRWKLDDGDGIWPYKIELEPVDPDLLPVFGREEKSIMAVTSRALSIRTGFTSSRLLLSTLRPLSGMSRSLVAAASNTKATRL